MKKPISAKPDIVLITGDLIDSEAAFVPGELEPLARFSAPVYYVGGNHEKHVDAERAFALVKKYGVNVSATRWSKATDSSSWASTT